MEKYVKLPKAVSHVYLILVVMFSFVLFGGADLRQELEAATAAPEMVPGTEYATGEKWNGAPVYVMAVDYGALPNDDEAENYDLPAGLNVISMEGFAVGPAYNIPIPGYYAVESMGYNRGTGNLWLSTTADLSAYHGYIRVKYTK